MTWLPMPYSKVSAGRNAMLSILPLLTPGPAPWEAGDGREELRPLNYPSPGLLSTAAVSRGWGGRGGGGKRPTSLSPASLTHSRGPEQSSSPAPPRATLFFLIFLLFLFFLCFSKCLDSVPLKSFSLPILLLFNFVFCFRSDSPYDAI